MKSITLTALVGTLILLTGCSSSPPLNQNGFKSSGRGYYAIDPIELPKTQAKIKEIAAKETAVLAGTTIPARTGPDPDIASLTSIGTVTTQNLASTEASLGAASIVDVEGSGKTIRLYSDNLIFRTIVQSYQINILDKNNSPVSYTVPVSLIVGVGTRIEGVLDTKKGKINVSGIPGFNSEVSGSVSSASASVYTIGVISPTLIKLPRFTGKITEENLYTFFQTLATVNSAIDEPETEITPHIMGFYYSAANPEVKPFHITSAIRWDAANYTTLAEFLKPKIKIIDESMRRSTLP